MGFRFPRLDILRHWHHHLGRFGEKAIACVMYPWNLLVGAFRWLGATLVHAWGTRHLRYALQGTPALLAMISVGVLAVKVKSMDPSNLASEYMKQAALAHREEKNDIAQSLLEKAIRLEHEKDEYCFYLAQIMEREAMTNTKLSLDERRAKFNHCEAIMKKLAPDNGTGFGPAHMWRAEFINRNNVHTKEVVDVIEKHLQNAWRSASSINPESNDSKYAALRLGELMVATGRLTESIPYLEKAAERDSYVRGLLATVFGRLNRTSDMERTLERLVSYCKLQIDLNPNDKRARATLGGALTDLANASNDDKKYAEAIEVFKTGLVHDRNEKAFQLMLANTYAAWDAALAKKPNAPLIQRFALIQNGLINWPTHEYHLRRLLDFMDLKGEDGEKAKKIMADLMADARSAPIVHFIMGNKAYQEDRLSEAQFHWEKSFALNPNFAYVANNLAWILCHQKEPDLARALQIINKTIETVPSIPNLYGTRGEILNKMGKHKEALTDLERAIASNPNDLSLQEAISDCHKQLGNMQMSEIHRKKADEIRAKRPKSPAIPESNPDPTVPAGTPSKTPPTTNPPSAPEPKSKSG